MLGKKALGAAAAQESLFIEDVFSTWLRTGTGADVTVTNNIDMTEGYLLWTKSRSAATDHAVYDSGRGVTKDLVTNSPAAETTQSTGLKAVSSTGYTIGSLAKMNTSGATYADWVFRKAPKFFDVVTYTGNGVNGRAISHNLGSIPRFIIVKRTDAVSEWRVYAYSPIVPQTFYLALNTTGADGQVTGGYIENATLTQFRTYEWASNISTVNANGGTYVAYLFASNAGGFGDAGDQNVVSCGSYVGNGSATGPTVTLGYEPQYLMVKRVDSAGYSWFVFDQMRGLSYTNANYLIPDSSAAESAWGSALFNVTATGFNVVTSNPSFNANGGTYIYLAIRRGPMKTPTVGTSVYNATKTSASSGTIITTGFPADLSLLKYLDGSDPPRWNDRLRGYANNVGNPAPILFSSSTNAEAPAGSSAVASVWNTGFKVGTSLANLNSNYYSFRRAPGFFDVVCYTGTGVARTVNHNLGVAPELMIVKRRSDTGYWIVGSEELAAEKVLFLNITLASSTATTQFNSTRPTASVFTVGTNPDVNGAGSTYVAYLFASLPGVSKVGSYTGTGGTQTINAGLPTGARFVLIKRYDSTGNWWVWDTTRGMVAGTDPRLALNTTDAEVNNNWVYTIANGFQIVTTDATINASGGSYIYLAVS